MRVFKPIFFKSASKLPTGTKTVDIFENAIKELFFVRNPKFKFSPKPQEQLFAFINKNKIKPVWIYFPWKKMAVKCVPEDIYFELRTNRNKDIISKNEQLNFRKLKVGVAGLSVGSAILSALNISGGPKFLKIADFDVLETTNLNRLHANLTDFGQNKTFIAAKRLWELDPFLNLELYSNGLTKKNLEKFLLKPRLDVFVDEMDNLQIKILARQLCKKYKIPVLMATDNGDGVILDVERYDQNSKILPFDGKLKNFDFNNLNEINYSKWMNIAKTIVGKRFLHSKMLTSVRKIGTSLTAVPQLGTTANMAGSAVSLAIRKIANNEKLISGRYVFDLEKNFYATRS